MGNNFNQYVDIEHYLLYVLETIKHYGFVGKGKVTGATNKNIKATCDKAYEFMYPHHFNYRTDILKEMERIGFNSKKKEHKDNLNKMLKWIKNIEDDSQYIHNLKIAMENEYCEYRNIGLITSLAPAYFKAKKKEELRYRMEAKRMEIDAAKSDKVYIGNVGDRIDLSVRMVRAIRRYETSFGINTVYRFETTDGEVLIWKTSKVIENIENVKKIKATVKKHGKYGGEKQTELSRVKIIVE